MAVANAGGGRFQTLMLMILHLKSGRLYSMKNPTTLCTFAPFSKLDDVVEIIVECIDILYNKIYVFENVKRRSF